MTLHNNPFDFGRVTKRDQGIAASYIGSLYRPPDLVIAPTGHGEYLFRWYVTPHSLEANTYFHIQTASDPERPLHDHPWDNASVILSGGYDEVMLDNPADLGEERKVLLRREGDVIHRTATMAHRLILPAHIPYSMSLFRTGPKLRDWGFWQQGKFLPWKDITIESEGHSTWNKEKLDAN